MDKLSSCSPPPRERLPLLPRALSTCLGDDRRGLSIAAAIPAPPIQMDLASALSTPASHSAHTGLPLSPHLPPAQPTPASLCRLLPAPPSMRGGGEKATRLARRDIASPPPWVSDPPPTRRLVKCPRPWPAAEVAHQQRWQRQQARLARGEGSTQLLPTTPPPSPASAAAATAYMAAAGTPAPAAAATAATAGGS